MGAGRKKTEEEGRGYALSRLSEQEELQQVVLGSEPRFGFSVLPARLSSLPTPLFTARPNTPIQTPRRALTHAHSPSPSTLRRKAGKCIEDLPLKAERLT